MKFNWLAAFLRSILLEEVLIGSENTRRRWNMPSVFVIDSTYQLISIFTLPLSRALGMILIWWVQDHRKWIKQTYLKIERKEIIIFLIQTFLILISKNNQAHTVSVWTSPKINGFKSTYWIHYKEGFVQWQKNFYVNFGWTFECVSGRFWLVNCVFITQYKSIKMHFDMLPTTLACNYQKKMIYHTAWWGQIY